MQWHLTSLSFIKFVMFLIIKETSTSGGTWCGIRLQTGDVPPAALCVGDCGVLGHDAVLGTGGQSREGASFLAHLCGCWSRAIL